jgi:nucleotide-binding universal stress UspA family protein
LAQNQQSKILANADFSASDYPSLDAAVDFDLKEAEKNRRNLSVTVRERQKLGSLNAMRVVMKYKNQSSDSTMVEETVTAVRRAKRPEEGVLYTVRLLTPEERYTNDFKIFSGIIKSWRLRPLPK